MIDYQRIYHTGIRVPDLPRAMAEYTAALNISWATVQHSDERTVWTPQRGLEQVALTFVYSCEGPQHIELLQGQRGTVWDGTDQPGLHHVGLWSADLVADVETCLRVGWTVAAAAIAPDDGYGSFAYVRPPSGLIVELVTDAAQPRFERWWAGGAL